MGPAWAIVASFALVILVGMAVSVFLGPNDG
jgi:hypothetical protein